MCLTSLVGNALDVLALLLLIIGVCWSVSQYSWSWDMFASSSYFPLKRVSIQRLMVQFQYVSIPFAYFGTFISSPSSLLNHLKIIDLGASHHMSGMSSLFSLYCVCFDRDKVHIADGLLLFVAGTCCIPLTFSLPLSFVFYVLNFKLNLAFISHILKL